jgi:hypothetical protein
VAQHPLHLGQFGRHQVAVLKAAGIRLPLDVQIDPTGALEAVAEAVGAGLHGFGAGLSRGGCSAGQQEQQRQQQTHPPLRREPSPAALCNNR